MTGLSLQIKALPINLDNMPRLQLTPKNGIREEVNTTPYTMALKERDDNLRIQYDLNNKVEVKR